MALALWLYMGKGPGGGAALDKASRWNWGFQVELPGSTELGKAQLNWALQREQKSTTLKAGLALAGVAQLVGVLSYKPKGCRFNSQSGHIPRWLVPSLVGGEQEATDQCFSLATMFLFCSFPPSLFLSLKIINMPLDKMKIKNNNNKRQGWKGEAGKRKRFLSFFLKYFIYFLERRERREKERERNINACLPLMHPPLQTQPTTQACAPTESNWRCFGSQARTQSIELHQPGRRDF